MYADSNHTKRLLCYLASSFCESARLTSYDWQATALKLSVTLSTDNLCAWSSTSVQLFQAWRV